MFIKLRSTKTYAVRDFYIVSNVLNLHPFTTMAYFVTTNPGDLEFDLLNLCWPPSYS